MPEAKKDKLLLRLIAKNEDLARKLAFELMEDSPTEAMEARRDKILQSFMEGMKKVKAWRYVNTPGELLMQLRAMSGVTTDHVKITKDKVGDVLLNATMICLAFEHFGEMLAEKAHRADTFCPYIVKRASSVLAKAEKLHEDYYLEVRRPIEQMLAYIHGYAPAKYDIEDMQLPKNWGL